MIFETGPGLAVSDPGGSNVAMLDGHGCNCGPPLDKRSSAGRRRLRTSLFSTAVELFEHRSHISVTQTGGNGAVKEFESRGCR